MASLESDRVPAVGIPNVGNAVGGSFFFLDMISFGGFVFFPEGGVFNSSNVAGGSFFTGNYLRG